MTKKKTTPIKKRQPKSMEELGYSEVASIEDSPLPRNGVVPPLDTNASSLLTKKKRSSIRKLKKNASSSQLDEFFDDSMKRADPGLSSDEAIPQLEKSLFNDFARDAGATRPENEIAKIVGRCPDATAFRMDFGPFTLSSRMEIYVKSCHDDGIGNPAYYPEIEYEYIVELTLNTTGIELPKRLFRGKSFMDAMEQAAECLSAARAWCADFHKIFDRDFWPQMVKLRASGGETLPFLMQKYAGDKRKGKD